MRGSREARGEIGVIIESENMYGNIVLPNAEMWLNVQNIIKPSLLIALYRACVYHTRVDVQFISCVGGDCNVDMALRDSLQIKGLPKVHKSAGRDRMRVFNPVWMPYPGCIPGRSHTDNACCHFEGI